MKPTIGRSLVRACRHPEQKRRSSTPYPRSTTRWVVTILFLALSAGCSGDDASKPTDTTAPTGVSDLSAASATSTSLELTWTAVGDDGTVGVAMTYDIRYATSAGLSFDDMVPVSGEPAPAASGETESFPVTGLSSSTTYSFKMRVGDDAGNWSADSNEATETTLAEVDDSPPAAVDDLSISAQTATSLTLTWTAVGDDGTTGMASSYDLRYGAVPATPWNEMIEVSGEPSPQEAGQTESFVVTGLSYDTTYHFRLKVSDEAMNGSEESNEVSGTTLSAPDTIPPAAVTDLAVGEPTSTSLQLTWTAVGDDSLVGRASTYDIRYATSAGAPWNQMTSIWTGMIPREPGETESYTVTNLTNETSYFFRLAVSDEATNWSPESNEASGTTGFQTVPPGPMVLIEAGTFTMGSPEEEPGRDTDEVPHQVTLTRPFYLYVYEVTQEEWQSLMGWNDSYFIGDVRPVEKVNWFDCLLFCNQRSEADGFTPAYVLEYPVFDGVHLVAATVTWDRDADGYRLPTEAEWEYACRAGSTTAFCNGTITELGCSIDPLLDQVGWFCGNSAYGSHQVGTRDPNAWGIYDMHGNVAEWCYDGYGAYPSGPVTDPVGGSSPNGRIRRGGGWSDQAKTCRSANRASHPPTSTSNEWGLRLARNGR